MSDEIRQLVARLSLPLEPGEIRALRLHLGFTQGELAAMLGAHPVTISRWERAATGYAPDPWQTGILRTVACGLAAEPSCVHAAREAARAGRPVVALGVLLGAAARHAPPPDLLPRPARTGPRRRHPSPPA